MNQNLPAVPDQESSQEEPKKRRRKLTRQTTLEEEQSMTGTGAETPLPPGPQDVAAVIGHAAMLRLASKLPLAARGRKERLLYVPAEIERKDAFSDLLGGHETAMKLVMRFGGKILRLPAA